MSNQTNLKALTLSGLIFLLLLTIIPAPKSLAQSASSPCPVNSSSQGTIRLSQGFLTTSSTQSNIFSLQITPTPGTSAPCVIGDRAYIPESPLTSYGDIKPLYYDQANTTNKDSTPLANGITKLAAVPFSATEVTAHLYNVPGDLIVPGNPTGQNTKVFFVDHDLLIADDLTYGDNASGIVFVVGGNVYIDHNVSQVNAFIVTYGEFCSASTTVETVASSTIEVNTTCTTSSLPLTINGSVVSLNPLVSPKFVRDLGSTTNTSRAAETINYKPKYLVLLKDVFSKERTIWSEVQ